MISYKTYLCFPEDFTQFNTHEDNGNDISDSDIVKWIEEGVSYLKANPKERYYYCQSGNTNVTVLNEGDDFKVIVGKNYWEKELPIDCEVKE